MLWRIVGHPEQAEIDDSIAQFTLILPLTRKLYRHVSLLTFQLLDRSHIRCLRDQTDRAGSDVDGKTSTAYTAADILQTTGLHGATIDRGNMPHKYRFCQNTL
jgi:hypothetical protein